MHMHVVKAHESLCLYEPVSCVVSGDDVVSPTRPLRAHTAISPHHNAVSPTSLPKAGMLKGAGVCMYDMIRMERMERM